MKGKIIVIEGIDGSGKNTQSLFLYEFLLGKGYNTKVLHFPLYNETFFGHEVANYLNGSFGKLNDVHPKLSAFLYAGDRYEKRDYILSELEKGTILVLDRYVPSNMAHHSVKLPPELRKEFIDWIKQLEYSVFKLPKPDFVIFLDMPPEISQTLILKKSPRTYTDKKQDLHEENINYLSDVYKMFKELVLTENWHSINCTRDRVPRPIDDIQNEIINFVSKCLKIDI